MRIFFIVSISLVLYSILPASAATSLNTIFIPGEYSAKDPETCFSGGELKFRDYNRGLILGDRIAFTSLDGKKHIEKFELNKMNCNVETYSKFIEKKQKLIETTTRICKSKTRIEKDIFVVSLEKHGNNLIYKIHQQVNGKKIGKKTCIYIKQP